MPPYYANSLDKCKVLFSTDPRRRSPQPQSFSHTRPHPTPQRNGDSPAYYRFFPFPAPAKPPQRAKKSRAETLPPQAPPPKPKTKSISSQAVRERVSRLRGTSLRLSAGGEVLVRFDSRGFALFAASSGTAEDYRCYNEWMLRVVRSNTNLSRKCDFRRFYCRPGVSPA